MKLHSSTELIELAKKHKENIGEDKATFFEGVLYGYGTGALYVKKHFEAELEQLQNRSCESCAYYDDFNGGCFNSDSPLCADFVDGDFYCSYYERKKDDTTK